GILSRLVLCRTSCMGLWSTNFHRQAHRLAHRPQRQTSVELEPNCWWGDGMAGEGKKLRLDARLALKASSTKLAVLIRVATNAASRPWAARSEQHGNRGTSTLSALRQLERLGRLPKVQRSLQELLCFSNAAAISAGLRICPPLHDDMGQAAEMAERSGRNGRQEDRGSLLLLRLSH